MKCQMTPNNSTQRWAIGVPPRMPIVRPLPHSRTPGNDTSPVPARADFLFSGARRPRKAATAPSTAHDWYDCTTGYKEAADILVAHVESDGRRADNLRYPILFLYSHHLELAVKGLIRTCCAPCPPANKTSRIITALMSFGRCARSYCASCYRTHASRKLATPHVCSASSVPSILTSIDFGLQRTDSATPPCPQGLILISAPCGPWRASYGSSSTASRLHSQRSARLRNLRMHATAARWARSSASARR